MQDILSFQFITFENSLIFLRDFKEIPPIMKACHLFEQEMSIGCENEIGKIQP